MSLRAICWLSGGTLCAALSSDGSGGSYKTVGRMSDKILSSCLFKGLTDKVGILGPIVLKKSALKLFFVIVGHNVYRLHIKRIYSRVEHYRRCSSGCRIIILNLLGRIVIALKTKSKLYRLVKGRSGMA